MNHYFRSGLTLIVAMSIGVLSVRAAQIQTFGELGIAADDGSFSAQIHGRVHADANIYDSDSEAKRLRSGSFIRRARIGLSGNLQAYEYEVEADFADNQAELKNGYVRRIFGTGRLWFGQFKVMEGLEELASSNDIVFIERSYVSALTPHFKIGVAYNDANSLFGYSANFYNLRESSDDEARPTNSGVGGVARAYIAPINDRMLALHFGGSYAYEETDSVGQDVDVSPIGRAERYRDGTDFRFKIYDRLLERAEINRINAEAAMINGPLTIQGEALFGSADTKTKVADDFNAFYIQASYVLTGEWRRYDMLRGRIRNPEPSRAMGAIEIAARYQRAEREKVNNAVLTSTEFGVTYYANMNVRFMLNYGFADNNLNNDKPGLLSGRAQFNF